MTQPKQSKPSPREDDDMPPPIAGAEVVVIGMARSGLAAALMLAGRGAQVFVSDSGTEESLKSPVESLRARGIRYEIGRHTLDCLDHADFVIASPGVKADNPIIAAALQRELPVYSEIEAAFWLSSAPVLAVTGANGKTTTTAWLSAIYRGAGKAAEVGGNIGRAYADFATAIPPNARAILEVSSFQLERIDTFRPHVAAILNITPDHLDRHGNMAEYTRLKFRLLENQTSADHAVLNADDDIIGRWNLDHPRGGSHKWWFSSAQPVAPGVWVEDGLLKFDTGAVRGTIPGSDRLRPPGLHNQMNAAAAVAMALADGLSPAEIEPGLMGFAGCEHRLETVADVDGVTYVNDSKATNPDSVAKAIAAFSRPLVVIMGGLDKGTDFGFLAEELSRRSRLLVFTGAAAAKLEFQLGGRAPHRTIPDFAGAFAAASTAARPGDVVLLSPGCASFDQFDNFEHRGRVFKDLVTNLARSRGKPGA
ncbi:MAG: UDP-N-acetylmuramoyl-L-alanine--D-glutamate ligase [candidate division Zixibacteria bacterium]|nr:UDP-N-acetylmuramoyl-L-alanine--D-glutamate ligase [candidate division Zixibacteria bacterium]